MGAQARGWMGPVTALPVVLALALFQAHQGNQPLAVFAGLVVLACLAARALPRLKGVPMSGLYAVAGGTALLSCSAFMLGDAFLRAPAHMAPIYALCAGLVIGMGADTRARRQALATSVALAALAALLWAAPGRLEGAPLAGWFKDYNSTAGLLNLGVFASAAVAVRAHAPSSKIAAWGLAALLAAGVLWSGSRGALLALGVGVTALALVRLPAVLRGIRANPARSAALVLAITASSVAAVYAVGDRAVDRLSRLGTDNSVQDRLAMWDAGIAAFKDGHPALGRGMAPWESFYPRYRTTDFESTGGHAHNDYLELLARGGLVGLGFAGLLVLMALSALLAGRGNLPQAILAAGVLTTMAHATVNFPLQNEALTLPLGLLLGLAVGAHRRPGLCLERQQPFSWLVFAAAVAVALGSYGRVALEWTVSVAAFQGDKWPAQVAPWLGAESRLIGLFGTHGERALTAEPAVALATYYSMRGFGDTSLSEAERKTWIARALVTLGSGGGAQAGAQFAQEVQILRRAIKAGLSPEAMTLKDLLERVDTALPRYNGVAAVWRQKSLLVGDVAGPEAEAAFVEEVLRKRPSLAVLYDYERRRAELQAPKPAAPDQGYSLSSPPSDTSRSSTMRAM